MKILIVGCGYVGTALGEKLVSSGAEVWGLRRDPGALRGLASKGIQPVSADLLEPRSLQALPDVDTLVFCQALSRPTDNYQQTYPQATRNLIETYRFNPPKKIVLISSTSVYSQHDGSWIYESTNPLEAGYESEESKNNAAALLESEKAVFSSGIPSVVFRLAGIYGPGRNRIRAIKEGTLKPVFSDTYTNRIHLDDIISGIILLIEKGMPGEVYLGADDYPSTQKEFYSWVYEKLNLPRPEAPVSAPQRHAHASSKRCSNQKIKRLGLELKYATFYEGYAEWVRSEAGV